MSTGRELDSEALASARNLPEGERHKIRVQREALLSPPSPDESSTMTKDSTAAPSPKDPAVQKEEKDMSRASTAAKDKLRPRAAQQRKSSVEDSPKKTAGSLQSPSGAKAMPRMPTASQSQSLDRPSRSPSILSMSDPDHHDSSSLLTTPRRRTMAEFRNEARRTAKEAVAGEKKRAFQRRMQEDTSTRALLFLQAKQHAPGIKLESAVRELKTSVASRYNTLFGALNAGLHEIQHALITAADDSTVRDVGAVAAMHAERRRAIHHTRSQLASPTASREFAFSSPLRPLAPRPHTSSGTPRAPLALSASQPLVASEPSADDPAAAPGAPKPEHSAASLTPSAPGGVRFADSASFRALPPVRQPSSISAAAGPEPDAALPERDLPGQPGTAAINDGLLRPAWPQAARIRRLKTETLVVKVSIARVRGLLPPSDCMSFPGMALVVSLDEDTRVVPLKVYFHSSFAHSCTVWKAPFEFEFRFDGILSECPLYIGVHRLPEAFAYEFPPDAASVAVLDWQKLLGIPHSSDTSEDVAGHGNFMSGVKAQLDLLPRNTALRTTLSMSSSGLATRSKQHFIAGEELRARGEKNYAHFAEAYEVLERQRASKPLEHLFASTQPGESQGGQAERRASAAEEKAVTPGRASRKKGTPRPARTDTHQLRRVRSAASGAGEAAERTLSVASSTEEDVDEDREAREIEWDADRVGREPSGFAELEQQFATERRAALQRQRSRGLNRGGTFVDEDVAWVHGGPSVMERSLLRHSVNAPYVSLYREYTEEEAAAAVALQRVVRGHKGRLFARQHKVKVEQLREEALRLGLDNEEQLRAARTIQVIIRFFWKSRARKLKGNQSPLASLVARHPKKQVQQALVKDDGQGMLDLSIRVLNIEGRSALSTSNLSYTQQEPTLHIPCCDLLITPQGVKAASDSKVSYLKHVFPFASGVASLGTKNNKMDLRARSQEVDTVAKKYTSFKSAAPPAGFLDPSTSTRVWEQVRHEHPDEENMQRPHSAGASQRVFRVRRYALTDYQQRQLLRNEVTAHVRVLAHCPESHFEVVRNAYLESTPAGPFAVTLVEEDVGDISLEAAVQNAGAVPEPVLSVLLRDLLLVVQQLHGVCGCIHNDLDLRNVHISRLSGELKLGGFHFAQFPALQPGCSLANRTDDGDASARRFMGPLRHQAPERILGLECGTASDIWSLGVIARTLVTGAFPWEVEERSALGFKTQVVEGQLRPLLVNPVEEMVLSAAFGEQAHRAQGRHENAVALRRLHQMSDINEWMSKVKIGQRTPAPQYYSRELSDLIVTMMDKSPHKRPSIKALLAHRFFRRFRPDPQELKQWLKKHRATLSAGDASLMFLEENSLFKRVNSSHFISPARSDALQGALARSILGGLG